MFSSPNSGRFRAAIRRAGQHARAPRLAGKGSRRGALGTDAMETLRRRPDVAGGWGALRAKLGF